MFRLESLIRDCEGSCVVNGDESDWEETWETYKKVSSCETECVRQATIVCSSEPEAYDVCGVPQQENN